MPKSTTAIPTHPDHLNHLTPPSPTQPPPCPPFRGHCRLAAIEAGDLGAVTALLDDGAAVGVAGGTAAAAGPDADGGADGEPDDGATEAVTAMMAGPGTRGRGLATPLEAAVAAGREDVVGLLLDRGADPATPDSDVSGEAVYAWTPPAHTLTPQVTLHHAHHAHPHPHIHPHPSLHRNLQFVIFPGSDK